MRIRALPQAIIIAGPNGAGKTTFARQMLPVLLPRGTFINADDIGRDLATTMPTAGKMYRDLQAMRMLLRSIDEASAVKADFAVETTLSAKTYLDQIPVWRATGYRIILHFLHLASVEQSIARVRRRVAYGGHDIDEATLRSRFGEIAKLLPVYQEAVDECYLYELGDTGVFQLKEVSVKP
jgi:predicted ABC-type ATPase